MVRYCNLCKSDMNDFPCKLVFHYGTQTKTLYVCRNCVKHWYKTVTQAPFWIVNKKVPKKKGFH